MEKSLESSSAEEENFEYYKKLALEYKQRFEETQQELQEFQEGSRELEAELETQLVQSEAKVRDLQSTNELLKSENERLQAKLSEYKSESSISINVLQDELAQTKLMRDDLQQYVRKLEQKNDDLERAMRASVATLEDFEGRLNQAIERNAFLENELDEKENMAILIQRLKDETRDLKQELIIHESPRPNEAPKTPEKIVDPVKITAETSPPSSSLPRFKLRSNGHTRPNGVTSPPINVPYSALTIVGDLLKKVGVLESKLQSCRNCLKDSSEMVVEKRSPSKLTTSSNVRHVNGSSLSTPKDCIPLTA